FSGGGGGAAAGGARTTTGSSGSAGSPAASGSSGSRGVDNLGGVQVGDTVLVTFSNSTERMYTVKGIFQTKSQQLDSKAFFNGQELGKILGVANLASEIVVKIDENQTNETAVINAIRSVGYSKLTLTSWEDMTSSVSSINSSFQVVNIVFTIISLVITAITIFIIIFINVTNKKRHIGGLRAIGIHRNIIILSNIFLGLLYVVVGIAIGIIFTYCVVVPFTQYYPIKMPTGEASLLVAPGTVILAAVGMTLVSIGSSFFPSWMVARQSILKTLWG
ncbi:MAG: FtsX-like permease family protein, partial [bacterium]